MSTTTETAAEKTERQERETLIWLGRRVYEAAVADDAAERISEECALATRLFVALPSMFGATPTRGRVTTEQAQAMAERAALAAPMARDAYLAAGRPHARVWRVPADLMPKGPNWSGRARTRIVRGHEVADAAVAFVSVASTLPETLGLLLERRLTGGTVSNSYGKKGRAYGDVVLLWGGIAGFDCVVYAKGRRGDAIASLSLGIPGGALDDHGRAVLRALRWDAVGTRWVPPRRRPPAV